MSIGNRPLSPHLQVYRPQITSVLSILHRMTGALLALGLPALAAWLLAAAAGPESFATAQALAGSWIGQLFLFAWSFALFYHLCNGIRHLFWDAGLGFELPTVQASGLTALAAATALTALAWAIVAIVTGGVG
jgi:succinate dehydrogenase / fumarate reductase cytochrome b subunit